MHAADREGLPSAEHQPRRVLLLSCPGQIELVDLPGGTHERAVTPEAGPGDYRSAVAAGRYWLQERLDGYHSETVEYRNRVTGEVRRVDGIGDYADLDVPELVAPLCAPLQRFRTPDDPYLVRQPYWPLAYDGQVAYFGRRVWRCDQSRPQTFKRSQDLSASAGWATWAAGGEIHAQRLRDGRRLRWRLRTGKLSGVVHTARAVYVTQGRRVFRARLRVSS